MEILAQINNEEVEFKFVSPEQFIDYSFESSKIDAESWRGVNIDYPNSFIEFTSFEDKVLEIKYSNDIEIVEGDPVATKELLISRIEEKLEYIVNSRESGIEYTGESQEIAPLAVPKPYDPDKIKVRQDKFSVEYVVNTMIGKGRIDLNPDFQRKFVWDKRRQSNLIESLMLGIPIPVFYLAEGDEGKFHVIDGLQRLSTLRDFLNNKFYLRNLEHLSNYDNCYYDQILQKGKKILDTKMLTRIETAQLHFNIIEATSPSEVKYDIFTRLNTGGQPLNNQEVRNCLANSTVRHFLNSCSNCEYFKNATGFSIKSKRMEDQEMVLRFAGFYLQKIQQIEYPGDMNPFLNDVLDLLNKKDDILLDLIIFKFKNAMKNAYHLFGKYSFRKCLPEDLEPKAKKPYINKSMFVVWSMALSELDNSNLEEKIEFESFAKIVANEMQDVDQHEDIVFKQPSEYYWLFTTGTSDKKSLTRAGQLTEKIIQKNLIPLL